MKFIHKDSRDECPVDQKEGVYYVVKKRTLAMFSFGKCSSRFETIGEAHAALNSFLSKRKDAKELTVQLLNTHF